MFNVDSKFYRFCLMLYRLILLNIITLIACLPIISIGAAISALVKVLYYKDAQILASYWRYFRKDLWKSIPILLFNMVSLLFVQTISKLNIGESYFLFFLLWLFIFFLYTFNVNSYLAFIFKSQINYLQVFQTSFYISIWTFYKTFWIPILMYLLIMYTYNFTGLLLLLLFISFPIWLHLSIIRKNIELIFENENIEENKSMKI